MLEDDAAIGTGRRDRFAFDQDAAGFDREKAADEIKQRGFSAARRAEQGEELAGAHLERDFAKREHGTPARRAVGMTHPVDDDLRCAVHAVPTRSRYSLLYWWTAA